MLDSVIETEPKYLVSSSPIVVRHREIEMLDQWVLSVGNTGMMLVQNRNGSNGDSQQHFLPDNSDRVKPGDEIKFSLIYADALSSLIKWYQTYEEAPDKMVKPRKLFGCTNKTMHEFRSHLLGSEIYKEDGSEDETFYYTLDLEKLSNDSALIKKIDRLAERCKKMGYTTQFDVQK